ncbi:MAG: pseudouridine-5'-phosphate glycosidase [Geodermatophilaceae bacterium]|nr:pseudouridine-5'-phosphate glycosidase [Geodermatophilaceae bacterium]
MSLSPEVAQAQSRGGAVVALESTLIAHGLPRPDNLDVAREVEEIVRRYGATPATIAVLDGCVHIGLDDSALQRIAGEESIPKLGIRDLPVALATGGSGATTVSSTALLATRAGIAVFATGGLGGVHRGGGYDESADLTALAGTPILVVCAGVKSILDVEATLERLESLSVTVLGYRTYRFPGFYLTDSGFTLDWRVEQPAGAAAVFRARTQVQPGAVVVANPLPADEQLDPGLHDRVLADALAAADTDGITGKAVTPYLLANLHRVTGGESLRANVRIIQRNAELAAQIAVALAAAG